MRQKKGLIILVVILLALCGVYFGLKSYNKSQAKKEDQKEKEKTIQVLDIKNPVESPTVPMMEAVCPLSRRTAPGI